MWVVGVFAAAPAGAHAAYKTSNPADESSVSQAPAEVWAEYTEPLQEGSWMKIYDPCGDQVDGGNVRVEGYRMYVSMSGARQGTYKVTWMAASAIDPHTTKGSFVFTASEGDACPGDEVVREEKTEPKSNEGSEPEGQQATSNDDAASADAGNRVSAAGDGSRRTTAENDDRDAGRNESRNGSERSRNGRSDDEVLAQRETDGGSPADGPEEPGLLTGIPIGGLAVALAIAAAIGAAGGFIYAGIMGYHRPS